MIHNDWPVVKLADLCDSIDYGYTASASNNPVGSKFLRITDIVQGYLDWEQVPYCDIDKKKSRYQLHHKDIVIARTGATTGKSAYIQDPPDAIFASYLVRLKINQRANPRFISYCLKSHYFRNYIQGVVGGKSAQPNASASTMTQFELAVPPLSEQRAIAHILGALDDKIELNRQMNHTLEAIARAIFKSWFVDFDPVWARQASEQPYGMDAETAALFPDAFTDSSLGQIPQGWRVGTFDELIEIIGGGTPKTSVPEYWNGDIPWFSVKDLLTESDVYVINTERKVTQAGVDNSSTKVLAEGATIITARGTVGKLALVGVPMAMNQTCYGIRGSDGYPDLFTFFHLRSIVSELQQRTHGTVFDTITRNTFTTIETIIPPVEVAQVFDGHAEPMLRLIRTNLFQSHTLAELRDTLLPRLISGQLRVPDAEKLIGEIQ